MLKKSLSKLLVIAVLPLACGSVFAGSTSANVAVSASVAQNCTIGTTPLAFGAYDPVIANATAGLNASGSITVACAKGATGLTVGMGNGIQPAGTQRMMKGGTSLELLAYNLFQPPSNAAGVACSFPGTTAWGNTVGTDTLTLTNAPSKLARTYNVCGTIPGAQDVAADPSYTDTVIATINF